MVADVWPQPDPIEVIERALRNVIHDVLSSNFGPDWTKDKNVGLGSNWARQLELKRQGDQAKTKTVAYDIPLAYSEFSDLGKLLVNNKGLFDPIFGNYFGDWNVFYALYRYAEKLRNAIKHHRDISVAQRYLLAGIAGEIEDSVNLWRIRGRLRTRRLILQFRDLIPTQDKPDSAILTESIECIKQWGDRTQSAIKAIQLDLNEFEQIEEQFKFCIRGPLIEMEISTTPSTEPSYRIDNTPYKGVHAELRLDVGCKDKLGEFLKIIAKPYHYIAYDLVNRIDLQALKKWSMERAGLQPGSSGSTGQELTDIEYSFVRHRLRIGACNYPDERGGKFYITVEGPWRFWRAHSLITPDNLLSFMVGDTTPKAMMHLVKMSLVQRNSHVMSG